MNRFLISILAPLLMLGPTTALAETELTFNRISFNDSATREVENDLMVVVLFAQEEGPNAVQPAEQVNRAMDWALALAKESAEIKAQTLGYRSSAIYKDARIRGWRVRQSLQLESADSQALGGLAGRLQERLQIESIGYQVSDQRRRQVVAELTTDALGRFTERAKAVAETLGRRSYRLVRLNLNDNQAPPVPIMRGMVAEAQAGAVPAPARIEAGTQRITVTVNGEIELSDD